MTSDTPHVRRLDGLRVIALLKFGKGLLLLFTVLGVHQLLRPDVANRLYDWSTTLTDDTARESAQRFLDWLSGPGFTAVSRAQWVTLGYMAGACLIPVEIWELSGSSNHKLIVLAAMAVNVGVVWYLAVQLRRTRAVHAA
jgi:hypothetical protein